MQIQHPKIGLRIGPHGLFGSGHEGQTLAIGRQLHASETCEQASQLHGGQLTGSSARHRHGHDFARRQVVIGLGHAIGLVNNLAAIRREQLTRLVELAVGELFGHDFHVARRWNVDNPDMAMVFRIEIALAVKAIDGSSDDLDVALAIGVGRVFLRLLGDIVRISVRRERDALTVG